MVEEVSVQVAPVGHPESDKETFPENPPTDETVIPKVVVSP